MTDKELSIYDSFVGAQVFLRTNIGDFTPPSRVPALSIRLNAVVAALDKAKIGQMREAVSKEGLLDDLRLDLQNIARTARSIELDEAGFASPYQLPTNTSDTALTTHANRVLDLLQPQLSDSPAVQAAKADLTQKFITCDLAENFVTDLGVTRDALTRMDEAHELDNEEGVSSTTLIGELLRQGRDIIKQLNACMHNKYTRMSDKLRAWKSACHIVRPQKKKDEESPTPPPTPQG